MKILIALIYLGFSFKKQLFQIQAIKTVRYIICHYR